MVSKYTVEQSMVEIEEEPQVYYLSKITAVVVSEILGGHCQITED